MNNVFVDRFPDYLKDLRIGAGLTQDQLSERCEFAGQSRVGNYESGKRRPNLVDAAKLADALGSSRLDMLRCLAADAGITLGDTTMVDLAELQAVLGIAAKAVASTMPPAGEALADELERVAADHSDWQFATEVVKAVRSELPASRRRGAGSKPPAHP